MLVDEFHEAIVRVAMHRLTLKPPLQPRQLVKFKAFLTVELPKALPPGIVRSCATPKRSRTSPVREPAAQLGHLPSEEPSYVQTSGSPDLQALADIEPLSPLARSDTSLSQ